MLLEKKMTEYACQARPILCQLLSRMVELAQALTLLLIQLITAQHSSYADGVEASVKVTQAAPCLLVRNRRHDKRRLRRALIWAVWRSSAAFRR